MDVYGNVPLNSAHREIRVLMLHDGNEQDPVSCTLKRISLDDKNAKFNALSYVWGDAADTREIIVNGKIIHVTTNLGSALRHIRNYSEPNLDAFDIPMQILWIDAVCINQSDISERNQQVQMMKDIYSAAENVIVWLGDGNPHTDYAIDLMNTPDFLDQLDALLGSSRQPLNEEIRVETILKNDLCRRKWWKRAWVRQEFILASAEPFFICGRKGTSWRRLRRCFLSVPRSWDYPEIATKWSTFQKELVSISSENGPHPGIHPMSLDKIREEFHDEGFLPFCRAFQYLLQNSAATNPRDYVYGLLGLLDAETTDQISVDYSIEPLELYRQVGRVLWTRFPEYTLSQLLPILIFHGDESSSPSWVPDLQKQQFRGWRDYRALQAERAWRSQLHRPFIHNDDALILSGMNLDNVEAVYLTPSMFSNSNEMLAELRRLEKAMKVAINQQIPEHHRLHSLSGSKGQETVLQTLTKSIIANEEFYPGMPDDHFWEITMGREPHPADQSIARDGGDPTSFYSRLMTSLSGKFFHRSILITETGFVGIGAPQIEKGDVVTFVYGTSVPLILRPYAGHYRIVGCAYVSGLMDLKLLDKYYDQGLLSEERFVIR
ncbi:heterokaryon incompatibility protein-domain-containing protein [Halenospora varia]|nr:heterokaryon incompatibility protein-domain-containing protein [Halenospora varia]